VVIAVGIGLAAFFCRLLVHPWLTDRQPFLTVYLAVLAVALARGWRPALITWGIAGLLCWFFFVPIEGSFAVSTFADGVQVVAAALVSLAMIALAEWGRRAQARAAAGEVDLSRALGALHQGERDLEESRGFARLIVESATEFAILTTDLRGRLLSWNPGARAVFGYEAREVLGRDAALIFTPEDRAAAVPEAEMRRALESGRSEDERWHLRKDGSRFWASGALMPLRDAAGEPSGFLKILKDGTEQRRAREELERRAQELARSNADLEEFASIASHDLKEPLRGIANYANFILEDHAAELTGDVGERLQVITRLCARMDTFLDSLLEYSRAGRTQLRPEPCDLHEVVAEALDSLGPWMESFNVRVTVRPGLPRVPCDRARTLQVFTNLIANAVKYSDKPERRIEIGSIPGDPPAVYLRDNGIGIDPRHAEHIFRMFKRLHGRDRYGGGSGAGLTIVRKIVERHGGRIWVESTPGLGSTFFFTLSPDRESEPGRSRPGPGRPTPGRAEDEPSKQSSPQRTGQERPSAPQPEGLERE
jgi:PAS domain S-box-containing protein